MNHSIIKTEARLKYGSPIELMSKDPRGKQELMTDRKTTQGSNKHKKEWKIGKLRFEHCQIEAITCDTK